MEKKRTSRGFTLVELIVVIAIVAILASVGIVGYTQFIKNARNSNATNELNQVYNVIYIDAARPEELKEFPISTEGSLIRFLFDGFTDVEIKKNIEDLLAIYLNEGFYQGEFTFTENLLTFNNSDGGEASRRIIFDYGIEIHVFVKEDGSFSTTVNDIVED